MIPGRFQVHPCAVLEAPLFNAAMLLAFGRGD